MKFVHTTERDGEEVTLSTFIPKEGQSLSNGITETAISILISYAKMEKLLHKQLWDKDKLKAEGVQNEDWYVTANDGTIIEDYSPSDVPQRINLLDYPIDINGREAKAIKYWNIKSYSRNPYDPKDLVALGLNQLFVGQSAYAKYEGDPKDGIYHDDCLIQPRSIDLPSSDTYGWFIKDNGEWPERDAWGTILTTNVYIYEKFEEVCYDAVYDEDGNLVSEAYCEQVSQGDYVVVETPDGSSEFQLAEATSYDNQGVPTTYYPSVEYLNFSNPASSMDSGVSKIYPQWVDTSSISTANVLYETTDIAAVKYKGDFRALVLLRNSPEQLTRVYNDGTVLQIYQPTAWEESRDGLTTYKQQAGAYRKLPLVYTDTGELLQSRVDFIENWDDQFELYVNEDGYWYDGLITIVAIVVSVVLSVVSAGALSGLSYGAFLATTAGALAVMGGFIAGIGLVSGNKTLQIIGAVVSLGASAYSSGAQAVGRNAAIQAGKGASKSAVQTAIQEVAVLEAIRGLPNIGMMNQLKLALDLTGVGLQIAAATDSATALPDATSQAEEGMRSGGPGEDKEEDYIKKVMNIGVKPINGMYDAGQIARL